MNRAFVSLYLIIVLSIVLLGLVLNKFWDEVRPQEQVDPAVLDLIRLLETSLEHSHNPDKNAHLQSLTAHLSYKAELTSILNFSKTDIAEKITRGEFINVNDATMHYFYKRLGQSEHVLMLSHPIYAEIPNGIYIGFILLFYSSIAVAVFLWVWPLTRDLARLASHARQIGQDGQQSIINISSRSVLYPFAKTFNTMAGRLNEIMRSQREMTLAVSHELRTPLARMKFALAMMEGDKTPIIFQRQLASINRDILDMEGLITSFLAYAGFDQQSQQLNQKEGYIQELIQDIIVRMPNYQNIDINVQDRTRGQTIKCEWSLMQTAIQNLLHNALGYARNSVIISILLDFDDFVIEVEDDGPGVPEDQQDRIFESFVRLYSEVTNRSGFGLGLALVRRIMEWHLGSVSCTRSPLGGAKFTLKWPRC